ncbi:MAG: N-acetylglucosamine-6-phosphate deacetylase, partial [Propionibacteriales bacterium]|nr:N-acetylglucosamine-6-phosphate deacetylase [Propionibacteriales bacterium]
RPGGRCPLAGGGARRWAAPGFVDTHVHGGGGGDFGTTDADSAVRAQEFHQRHGSTTLIASVVTDTIEAMVEQVYMLRGLCADGRVAGIHLEGPFLSTARCGAHPPALLRSPDPASVEKLIMAGGDDLAMITIAPELPGAVDAIARFAEAGVAVAVGHTSGSAEDTRRALDAGASVATHLFNAMDPIHHRTPGPVPVLLTDPRALVELIADGTHLAPDVIAMAIRAAGADRVALITDAMVAAGLADGRYGLGQLKVEVCEGVARLVGADGTVGSIAGSTLNMAQAVEYVTSTVGVPLADAVRMATSTPAQRHGLDAGTLAPGRRADLVVLSPGGHLDQVMAAGRWLDTDEPTATQGDIR